VIYGADFNRGTIFYNVHKGLFAESCRSSRSRSHIIEAEASSRSSPARRTGMRPREAAMAAFA
jgi:hypothetical protein